MPFGDLIPLSFNVREDDTFIFSNAPANPPQTYALLASPWVQTAYPGLVLPNSTTILDPESFSDYQELIFDKEMTPKMIRGIRLIVQSQTQLVNPMVWSDQDANGEIRSYAEFPNNFLRPDQFQGRVIDLYYDNLVIGGNQYLAYTIDPGFSVSMTFVYDDFRLESLLGESPVFRKVMYSKKDVALMEKLL